MVGKGDMRASGGGGTAVRSWRPGGEGRKEEREHAEAGRCNSLRCLARTHARQYITAKQGVRMAHLSCRHPEVNGKALPHMERRKALILKTCSSR